MRKHCAGDRQQTEHVDVENGAYLVVGGLLDGAEQPAPCVVDQYVDPAEPGDGIVDGPSDLVWAVDVEGNGEELLAAVGQRVEDRLRVTCGGDDVVAARQRSLVISMPKPLEAPVMNHVFMTGEPQSWSDDSTTPCADCARCS